MQQIRYSSLWLRPVCNFSVVAIVSVIYSQCIKSAVPDALEARNADAEGQLQQGNRTRRRLFIAYCCQLATRFFLGIIFIVFKTQLLYPSNFPSNFKWCDLARREGNNSSYPSANVNNKSHKLSKATNTRMIRGIEHPPHKNFTCNILHSNKSQRQ